MTININLKTIINNNNNKAGDKSQNSSAGQDRAARSEMGEESGNDNNGRVFTARITTAGTGHKSININNIKKQCGTVPFAPITLSLEWHVKASKTLYFVR